MSLADVFECLGKCVRLLGTGPEERLEEGVEKAAAGVADGADPDLVDDDGEGRVVLNLKSST